MSNISDEVFPPEKKKRRVAVRRPRKKEDPQLSDDEMKWQTYFHKHKTSDPEPMVIIIWGPGGCGKTDLALRLAAEAGGPAYLIETEGGHNLHTANRVLPDIDLDLHKCVVDVMDSEAQFTQKWFSGGGRAWEVFEDIMHSLQHAPEGTVILDSGSDMLPMLISQFSIDWNRGDMAFPPMLYKQCYGKLRLEINGLRKNHNVIITAQEENKYDRRSDAPRVVGSKMGLWNKADYVSEHVIKIRNDDGQREFIVKERKDSFLHLDEVTWNQLQNGFTDQQIEASNHKKAVSAYRKGVSALDSLGIEVQQKEPVLGSDTNEILALVEAMREQYKTAKLTLDKEKKEKRDSKRIRK